MLHNEYDHIDMGVKNNSDGQLYIQFTNVFHVDVDQHLHVKIDSIAMKNVFVHPCLLLIYRLIDI